ncbi:hypothetical protein [Actinomadura rugatobispora]|uniref:Uncharacterized protein n=1 Tax=Actinomadura rugatobispora TaxID=1994 RepID=A0ABW0ZQK4_9ACTN|nr:hypothetical protein GCM10010200_036300 [Actinomadura rugatobispora]
MTTTTHTPACHCPPGATETLDNVILTRHTSLCPRLADGPRLYVWQGLAAPELLETGNLHDFAEAWAIHVEGRIPPGETIKPIEIRTWGKAYQARIVEQGIDDEEAFGKYLVTVDEESVVVHVYLAERR